MKLKLILIAVICFLCASIAIAQDTLMIKVSPVEIKFDTTPAHFWISMQIANQTAKSIFITESPQVYNLPAPEFNIGMRLFTTDSLKEVSYFVSYSSLDLGVPELVEIKPGEKRNIEFKVPGMLFQGKQTYAVFYLRTGNTNAIER